MDSYLLIESRDALESSDVATYFYDLAAGLASRTASSLRAGARRRRP